MEFMKQQCYSHSRRQLAVSAGVASNKQTAVFSDQKWFCTADFACKESRLACRAKFSHALVWPLDGIKDSHSLVWPLSGPSRTRGGFFDFEVGGHDGAYKGRVHVIVPFVGPKNGKLFDCQQSYNVLRVPGLEEGVMFGGKAL